MPDNQKLPLGISIASFAMAFIAVGSLWTRVEVMADDQVSEARVVRLETTMENIDEDVKDIKVTLKEHIEKQDQRMVAQQAMMQRILNSVEDP